jgi:hypothetical protein
MSSDAERLAYGVKAPREGSISAVAVTTSAGSAADTGVSTGQAFVTFICDVACYITFSNDGSNANITDPDGTAVAGDGRTWRIPADSPQPFLIQAGVDRYFKPRGTAAGTLRWYVSSL